MRPITKTANFHPAETSAGGKVFGEPVFHHYKKNDPVWTQHTPVCHLWKK
ncbi:MAG: hypothetical protein ABIP06_14685 [Pyrinomonadaceae bacterium]